MRNRFWWIEIMRGMLRFTCGIVYLSFHSIIFFLITLLGIYLLADGCIDLYRIISKKQMPYRHLSLYLGAATSSSLGLLCLFNPRITLVLMSFFFVCLLIVRGLKVFGEARRWQGRFVGLHWLYGITLVLLGLICLLPPLFVFVTTFLLFFIGIYTLGDGLYIAGRGLYIVFAARVQKKERQELVARSVLDIPAHLPSTTRRALLFVRRSGASGLGHVGWAFEWNNGWFNTGSVENYGNYTFAPAEKANFWTAHTTTPVETTLKLGSAYDEFKVFFVTIPQPKAAWNVVVWASRQPYRLVHQNCVDRAYDILQTYGLANLPDPATEYAPNDWYDSLAGRSNSTDNHPTLPIHIHQFSTRPLATQEIALKIPLSLKGTLPPWRTIGSGLRGLIEIRMIWQKMFHDINTIAMLPGNQCRKREER